MHYAAGGLIGMIWIRTVPKLGLPATLERSLFLATVFAAVVGLSILTYRYIERPFQDLLRGRSKRIEVAAPAP
jgi:peptidoglycan/LPS O-acetylase OafA/YrhL